MAAPAPISRDLLARLVLENRAGQPANTRSSAMVFPRAAVAALGLLIVSTSYPTAAPKFSEWSEPVNLGPAVNTPFNEGAPTVSKDRRSLYFASNRPGQLGGND